MPFQYTRPRIKSTTPAFKSSNNKVKIIIYKKKALIRAHAFPKPAIF